MAPVLASMPVHRSDAGGMHCTVRVTPVASSSSIMPTSGNGRLVFPPTGSIMPPLSTSRAAIHHGCCEGEADGVALTVAVTDTDGDTVTVAVTLLEAVGDVLGVTVTDGVTDADAVTEDVVVGVTLGDTVTDGVIEAEDVADCVTDGEVVTLVVGDTLAVTLTDADTDSDGETEAVTDVLGVTDVVSVTVGDTAVAAAATAATIGSMTGAHGQQMHHLTAALPLRRTGCRNGRRAGNRM